MPVADLKRRLESALAGGDRANIFTHLVAGRSRRAALLERPRERADSRPSTPGAAASAVSASTPLDETLATMEEALGGDRRKAELEAAASVRGECFEVESIAASLRYEGRSFAERYALRNYALPGPSPEAAREQVREVERLAALR